MEKLIICVWNKEQRVPARLYGKANAPGNFAVRVCRNPAKNRDRLKAKGMNAIVYNYGGSSGGGGGSGR